MTIPEVNKILVKKLKWVRPTKCIGSPAHF